MMNSKAESKSSFIRDLYDTIEIIVFAACAVLLIYSFVFRLCKVSGDSMDNTLANRQMLLVTNINYTPEAGDIIVFHQTTPEGAWGYNEPIVKRVIATENQTIDIDFDTWTVTITDIDGTVKVLDESEYMYLDTGENRRTSDAEFPLTVPEGKVFVLGDNRNNSSDSRSNLIGLVDTRRIIGKAVLRLTPFDKFGTLD
ncbi:MAG: signal peptidase I [Clostridia bacterium]|nr:signal peptidase I [Clostridia bacterium]